MAFFPLFGAQIFQFLLDLWVLELRRRREEGEKKGLLLGSCAQMQEKLIHAGEGREGMEL
jgi:hypothetical protein